jgi:hypothetical protein
MSINRFFRKIFHPRVEFTDNVRLVYIYAILRIYTTYRELLIQFSRNKLKPSYYEERYFYF